MNKITEKIMRTNFTKALKRLLIPALCIAVLGGGTCAFLLRTQIGEAVTYAQQEEMRGNENDSQREYGDFGHMLTRPSMVARAAVSVTGLLCLLTGFALWLLIAAWLYQAAVHSGMHGSLWLLLGLCGNIAAVVGFFLLRSLIRRKCEACGSYQPVNALYCTRCGAPLSVRCPECGAAGGKADHYCHSCGNSFAGE